MLYREAIAQLNALGIGVQQRRKRYAAPTNQYQLFWSESADAGVIRYVTLKPGLTPEQMLIVGNRIAEGRILKPLQD